MTDTIAAIATPKGTGGIAVIRISGPSAFEIGKKIFRPKNKKTPFADISPNTAVLGDITDNAGTLIDEGIAVKFSAPRSYTGEDTAEISCHGGVYIAFAVFEAAVNAGARPALPGEFTKTAYLNGKISLTGAEAVGRLISASGKNGARLARAQAKGSLSKKILAVSGKIKDILSEVYVFIDYPDEDLSDMPPGLMLEKLKGIKSELFGLRETYKIGRIISDGIECAIAGRPNSGKSTLLNLLSGSDTAIVHDTPGTTRDIVYAKTEIGGFAINLYDTAGIRESKSGIENIGIKKAREKIAGCGLIVGVFDAGSKLTGEDRNVIEILKKEKEAGKKIIAVFNKCDKAIKADPGEIPPDLGPVLAISAKFGTVSNSNISVIEAFGERLDELYSLGHRDLDAGEILTEERQYLEICAACENVGSAISALENGFTQDAAGLDLEYAVKNLDRCDSAAVAEDIVERIFKNFCIGK